MDLSRERIDKAACKLVLKGNPRLIFTDLSVRLMSSMGNSSKSDGSLPFPSSAASGLSSSELFSNASA